MLAEHEKSFADMKPYLDTLAKNASDHKVKILLIMVDGEGSIGATEEDARKDADTRHSKWVDIREISGGAIPYARNWAGRRAKVLKKHPAPAWMIWRKQSGAAFSKNSGEGPPTRKKN